MYEEKIDHVNTPTAKPEIPKKNYQLTVIVILIILLLFTGGIVWNTVSNKSKSTKEPVEETSIYEEEIKPADASIQLDLIKNKTKDSTVNIIVSGLNNKISQVEYEITYDSEGIIQGVNSGSKPVDTLNQDGFEREVYLGTCSKNVCRPHKSVESVTVTMVFTDITGRKSQISKDFTI